MASTIPTEASFSRKAYLLWLAISDPARFEEEEKADNARLAEQQGRDTTPRIKKVRRALFESFVWCTGSLLIGIVTGSVMGALFGAMINVAIGAVIFGTLIVLWASLALQGWEIQSWGGVTLGERVNRWVFRLLYSLGTALVVAGSVWSLRA